MNQNIRTYLAVALAAIVIIAGVYYVSRNTNPSIANISENTQSASSTVQNGTSTSTSTSSEGTVTGSKGTTVSLGSVAAPTDFAKPLTFPSSISAHDKAAIQAEFDTDVAAIRKASDDINAWADIAVLRKITQDYTGSAEIWTYLSKKYVDFAGPYSALADLYANYLKDYPKAEAYYLKVLSIDPTAVDVYASLAQLYQGPYPKSNTAVEDILKQGIARNPKTYQLQLQLARYYASKGRTADANAMYEAAATNASGQGMTDVAAQIRAEEAGK